MGDIPQNEQDWETLARVKEYKCGACGQLIPFGERQVYFETNLCGHCAHKVAKND